uniref:Nucleoside phosphorylase domain-containing protein n=1 Tax=Bionectria ochroleuca TaxID=29856 RepID=A0A8H7NM24_BIOOC
MRVAEGINGSTRALRREPRPPKNVPDVDRYVFGKIEHHMVVATSLAKYGTNEAACAATTMKHMFNLRFCLLVGIGGGAPSRDNDIRLGDVVVGVEVVQHDLGKRGGEALRGKNRLYGARRTS